mgnify:CR=1
HLQLPHVDVHVIREKKLAYVIIVTTIVAQININQSLMDLLP